MCCHGSGVDELEEPLGSSIWCWIFSVKYTFMWVINGPWKDKVLSLKKVVVKVCRIKGDLAVAPPGRLQRGGQTGPLKNLGWHTKTKSPKTEVQEFYDAVVANKID